MAIWVLLILYIVKVVYDYIVWVFFLIRGFMDVAFCPSVFELSFSILICVPSGGCLP